MVQQMPQPTLPDVIIDWCDVGPMEFHESTLNYPQHIRLRHIQRGLGEPPDLMAQMDSGDLGAPVKAFVSGGRWLVQCPTCRTALVACRHLPYFICVGCGSRPKKQWSPVIFPDDLEDIEHQLLTIPGFRTNAPERNWIPIEPRLAAKPGPAEEPRPVAKPS